MITALATALLLQIQVHEEPKDWKLLTSDNFNIHYPSDEMLDIAKHWAALFEDARIRISKSCGVLLDRRINVFLYKSYHDLASSSANAGFFIGHPGLHAGIQKREVAPCCRLDRSRAFAFAEPLRDRIFIHCQASDRWNSWFARHELVHQLQYQEFFPWKLPSYLLVLKDPIIPQWFWEGFADYGAGIFDSEKDEWVRDLAEERLYTLKELFQGDVLPRHDYLSVYYQGSMFFRFLNEKYGDGTAAKVFKEYAESFPLTMDRILRNATGHEREELEKEFTAWIKGLYEPRMKLRTDPAKRITETRQYYRVLTGGGSYSPDGKRLAYVSNKDVKDELYIDGRGVFGMRRGIDLQGLHSAPSWAPDSKSLVIAGWWMNRDYLIFIDPNGAIKSVLLDFDEIGEPDWSPTGDIVVFTAMKNGTSDLYSYNVKTGEVGRLTNDSGGDFSPECSPDGKRLAFLHEVQGRKEITLLNLETKERTTVGKTFALLESTTWTPDGKGIVVSADVDGVFDAFVIDVETGAAKRLTKVRGGVHSPFVTPDHKTLLFTYSKGRGSDLFTVPFEPQEEKAFAQEEREKWYDQFAPVEPRGTSGEKRRIFGVDFLATPFIAESLITPGLEFGIGDLDRETSAAIQAIYLYGAYTQVTASVVSHRYRPTVGAEYSLLRAGNFKTVGVGPFVEYPLLPTSSVSVGWTVRETTDFIEDFFDPQVTDSGPSVGFLWTNQAGVHPYDPSWGFTFTANYSVFRESFGGDRDLSELVTSFQTSYALQQDFLLWTRITYRREDGPLLLDEIPQIESVSRGGRDLIGTDLGCWTIELRFPLLRDLLWMPEEIIGLGELFVIKDVRGFFFADVGFAGFGIGDWFDRTFRAVALGGGIRIDLYISLWPITTYRVPIRTEVWASIVDQEAESGRVAAGFGFVFGF